MPQFSYVNDTSIIRHGRLAAPVPVLNLHHPDIRPGGRVIFLSPVRDSLGSGESRIRSGTTFFAMRSARVRCEWRVSFSKRKRERERDDKSIS